MPAERYDLVVVGAGPAGSAAAIAALRARPDAKVLLLDRAAPGRDKVCGDGIAPHAVTELTRLGVDAVEPAEHVAAVRLVAPRGRSSGAVTASPGYVVPRREFDERMLRAAIAAGARFEQHRVTTVQTDAEGAAVDGRWHAPAVIGADGATGVVRRAVGERPNRGRELAVALRGYAPTPSGTARELVIRWDSHRAGGLCYAWAFPTAQGTTNVGYGMSAAALTGGRAQLERRMRELLPEYDLAGVELTGHTLPLSVARPAAAVGPVLLVGDAASLINPLTGEGIYTAIASGALAGTAAVQHPSDAGRRYSDALDARFGRQFRQLRRLYPLVDSRIALDVVLRASERRPELFDRLLDVGLGDRAFRVRDVVAFAAAGWRRGGRSA